MCIYLVRHLKSPLPKCFFPKVASLSNFASNVYFDCRRPGYKVGGICVRSTRNRLLLAFSVVIACLSFSLIFKLLEGSDQLCITDLFIPYV